MTAKRRSIGSNFYRAPGEKAKNIMFDPRVFRGNTYSRPVDLKEQFFILQPKKLNLTPNTPPARLPPLTKTQKKGDSIKGREKGSTRNKSIKTSVEEEVGEREDAYEIVEGDNLEATPVEYLPLPKYIPPPYGIDEEIQVNDLELFNFDYEVVPFLELIVGRVFEQSLEELLEEDDINFTTQGRIVYSHLRNAELAEIQRWEDSSTRKDDEIKRREKQIASQKDHQEAVERKRWANEQAKFALLAVSNGSREQWIREQSHLFTTPQKYEVEEIFFPWLNAQVHKNIEKKQVARSLARDVYERTQVVAAQKLKQKRYDDEQRAHEQRTRGEMQLEDRLSMRARKRWLPALMDYLEEQETMKVEDTYALVLSKESFPEEYEKPTQAEGEGESGGEDEGEAESIEDGGEVNS